MNTSLQNHTCDLERLESFLSGDLSNVEERDFTLHLNTCESCRRTLQQQAAEPEAWTEAERLLKPSEFDLGTADADSDSVFRSRSTRQPLQIQNVLSALGPTDDPAMLGRLGGYEVSGVVGAGGMGVVLKAIDKSLDRTVAIKVLAPHLATSGAARKRFSREAKAAAAVLHPNVIAIHSVSNDESLPYLVMPYVRGTSLQKRLDNEGPLSLQEILRIGSQIAAGLAAAHAQGLVHRDIKPANILLEDGVERVTITDFGLARAVDDATITHSGVIAGTPQYMSPEQARGEAVDGRSDLFSLGSVLYAICTGRPPFRAETTYGVMRRITDDEPTSIREINPEIPEWLCLIISRLMSKRADERFQSAAEVSELFEKCLAHVQQPGTVPLPAFLLPPSKNRHFLSISRRSLGVIAMIAALGLGLLGMVAWQASEAPDIGGKWTGEEWGEVVLEKQEPGEYKGTYTDTFKKEPGTIELKWSRLEGRYKGTWKEEKERQGKISVRLIDGEIRGAWTASKKSGINPGNPELADLLWKRSGGNKRQNSPGTEAETSRFSDEELLQGTWTLVEMQYHGKKVEESDTSFWPHELLVVDDQLIKAYIRKDGTQTGGQQQGKFSLDSLTEPKQITVALFTEEWRGIYKLEGEEFTVCWDVIKNGDPKNDANRPREFGTTMDSERTLGIYKRKPEVLVDFYNIPVGGAAKATESLHKLKRSRSCFREGGTSDGVPLAVIRDPHHVCRQEPTLKAAIDEALRKGGIREIRWEEKKAKLKAHPMSEPGIRVRLLLSAETHSAEMMDKNKGFDGLSIMGTGLTGTIGGKPSSNLVAVMAHGCRLESFAEIRHRGKKYWDAEFFVPQSPTSDGSNHSLSQKMLDGMKEQGVEFQLDHYRGQPSEVLRSVKAPADPLQLPQSEQEKAAGKLVLVFFMDKSRRAVPCLVLNAGDKTIVVAASPAQIVPDGTVAAIDRTFLELPGKEPIEVTFDPRSTKELYVCNAPSNLHAIQLKDIAHVAPEDEDPVSALGVAPPLPRSARVVAIDQHAELELRERGIKHEFSGLIEIDQSFPEGTLLYKHGRLVGLTLLGSRFLGEKPNRSYVLPAQRLIELCERIGGGTAEPRVNSVEADANVSQTDFVINLGFERNGPGSATSDSPVLLQKGRIVPASEFKAYLEKEKLSLIRQHGDGATKTTTIRLNVDRDVRFDAVTALMKLCQEVGFQKFALRLEEEAVEKFVLEIVRTPFDFDESKGSWQGGAHEMQVLMSLNMVRPRDRVVKTLLKVVDRSEKGTMDQRRLAMMSLGGIAPKQVIPLLIKELDGAEHLPAGQFKTSFPYHEIAVLEQIGEEAKDAIPVLIKLLDSPDGLARESALLALVKIGPSSDEVMNAIAARFGKPEEPVWSRAVYEVGRYGKQAKPLGPTFVKLLSAKPQEARIWAAQALIKSGFDEGLGFETLIGDVAKGEPEDRGRAATALAALGRQAEPMIPKLRAFENDPDAHVRKEVRDAIRRIEKDDRIFTHAEEAAKTAASRKAAAAALEGPATGIEATSNELEYQRLEGVWRLASRIVDGVTTLDEFRMGGIYDIRNGHLGDARISLNPAKSPAEINLTITKGPDSGKVLHGIYEWVVDARGSKFLAISVSSKLTEAEDVASQRPKDFTVREGVDYVLLEKIRSGGQPHNKPTVSPPENKDSVDPYQAEYQRFEGTWRISVRTIDHAVSLGEFGKDGKHVIKDRQMGDARISLDPSKTPREIDIAFTKGPDKGKVLRGIYEWVDDARGTKLVRISVSTNLTNPGDAADIRPKDFKTRTAVDFAVWEQIKAGDSPAGISPKEPLQTDRSDATELKKFQGTWVLVSSEKDGEEKSEAKNPYGLTFTGTHWKVHRGEEVAIEGTLRLVDVASTPMKLDLLKPRGLGPDPTVDYGIYELKENTLRYCVRNGPTGSGGPGGMDISKLRPTEFATKDGDGRIFYVWKRAESEPPKDAAEAATRSAAAAAAALAQEKTAGEDVAASGPLEFLADFPNHREQTERELKGLTAPQFEAAVKARKLRFEKATKEGDPRYYLPTGDGHIVIVMFRGGQWSGIQRIRGENQSDPAKGELPDELGKPQRDTKARRQHQFPVGDNVKTIAYSADGKLIAIAKDQDNWKQSVQILDADVLVAGRPFLSISLQLTTKEEDAVLAATEGLPHIEVGPLAFSPDGTLLAIGTGLGQVKLFNPKTGELVRSLDDESAKLAEKKTPENLKSLKRAMGGVGSLAFSPDGSLLATSGSSFEDVARSWGGVQRLGRLGTGPGRLKVWEVKTGVLKHDLAGHSHVAAVSFSADGNLLASAGRWSDASNDGNGVIIWNSQTGKTTSKFVIEANSGTHAVIFSPTNKLVAIGSRHYDKENDTYTTSVSVAYALSGITEWRQTFPGWANPKGFSPDGESILALCGGESIRFIKTETGEVQHEIKVADYLPANPRQGAQWIDFSIAPLGHQLAIAGVDKERKGTIEIWNLRAPEATAKPAPK